MSAQYDQRLQTYSQNSIRPTPLTRSQPCRHPFFILSTPDHHPPCTIHHIFPPLRQQTHTHLFLLPHPKSAMLSVPSLAFSTCAPIPAGTLSLILLCLSFSPLLTTFSNSNLQSATAFSSSSYFFYPPAPLFTHIQKHTSHPSKVSIIDTVRCCIVVCLPVSYNL
ncbi:hypothetical protein B9Z19DRAFT_1092772, partial [Tuber borchii]